MALVMATASQEEEEEHRKEATEIEGNDLPMAAENVDSDAEKQAEDTPSFKNVDFGGSLHHVFLAVIPWCSPFSGRFTQFIFLVTSRKTSQVCSSTVLFVLLCSRSIWTVCD